MNSTPPDGSGRASTSPASGNGPSDRHTHLRVGDLEIDTLSRRVTRDGEAIQLPHLSWLLLLTLVERWPGVATQEELLAEVWPDVIVGEETLTQRIKLLRKSLGDDSRRPRYVTTVRSVGYRLAERVIPVGDTGPMPGAPDSPDAESSGRARRRGDRTWLLAVWIGGALAVIALLIGALIVRRGLTSHSGRATSAEAPTVLPFADATASLEAYNQYLLGRYHTFRQTPEDLKRAVGFLRRAVEIDPEFAEAWATLAWAHSFIGTTYGEEPPAAAYAAAREAAIRALALDPALADARSVYADILTWYDWDWPAAEREYRETMRLDPNNVLGYAIFLSTQLRQEEAIELVEGLLERIPDDPYVHVNAAWRFYGIRDYKRALTEAEAAGDHHDAASVRAWSLFALGETEAAVAIFERREADSDRQPTDLSSLAVVYAESGRRDEARELLTEMLALGDARYLSPNLVAAVYFALGDTDEGFAWLDRGLEARSREMVFLQIDHSYDGVRKDPRYQRLLQQMRFP